MQQINDSREMALYEESEEILAMRTKRLVDQMKAAIAAFPPETWPGSRMDISAQGEGRKFHPNRVLAEITPPVLHISMTKE